MNPVVSREGDPNLNLTGHRSIKTPLNRRLPGCNARHQGKNRDAPRLSGSSFRRFCCFSCVFRILFVFGCNGEGASGRRFLWQYFIFHIAGGGDEYSAACLYSALLFLHRDAESGHFELLDPDKHGESTRVKAGR